MTEAQSAQIQTQQLRGPKWVCRATCQSLECPLTESKGFRVSTTNRHHCPIFEAPNLIILVLVLVRKNLCLCTWVPGRHRLAERPSMWNLRQLQWASWDHTCSFLLLACPKPSLLVRNPDLITGNWNVTPSLIQMHLACSTCRYYHAKWYNVTEQHGRYLVGVARWCSHRTAASVLWY